MSEVDQHVGAYGKDDDVGNCYHDCDKRIYHPESRVSVPGSPEASLEGSGQKQQREPRDAGLIGEKNPVGRVPPFWTHGGALKMLKSIKKFNNLFGISSWFGSGAAAQDADKDAELSKQPEKAGKVKKVKKIRQLNFQEEAYILTLISTENQTELAPAIKPIFDQGKELEIISNLEIFIKARETEIEKICQQNFAVRSTILLFLCAMLAFTHSDEPKLTKNAVFWFSISISFSELHSIDGRLVRGETRY